PMLWAALGNHINVVEMLLDHGADVHARDGCGRTALHYAAMFHNLPLVVLLHKHLAEFSTFDLYGNTALHFAVVHADTDVATYILEHGAHIDAKSSRSPSHVTALHKAYFHHRHGMMRMLLDRGAE
ncbi:ankyrin repeat-containing domain protein, partial [Baffinella frigidus]